MKYNSMTVNPAEIAHYPQAADSRLAANLKIILARRWMVMGIIFSCLVIGMTYAVVAVPVYEANISIQVEDADRNATNLLGDTASSALNIKTSATGETEIIKSRMVLAQALDNTRLYISAEPRYLPLVGRWIARHASGLSDPEVWGTAGFVFGSEKIAVPLMDVPSLFEGTNFTLTTGHEKEFSLSHPDITGTIKGTVGVPLEVDIKGGPLKLLVANIEGLPGASFTLRRNSRQLTLLALQDELKVIEKGKQSGVLDISWQYDDRNALTALLNEIGRLYLRQNVDRKTAEAERSLNFLNTELPKFKQQLEQSEESYNQFRNVNGTINLDDEARNALVQTVDIQNKLVDAKQRRLDLSARFTDQHPTVATLDSQIAVLATELSKVENRIRRMPALQQSSLRMQRDIKVNTDLYASLLNSSLQMRLAKEVKTGNVRIIDDAVTPEKPIRPKPLLVFLFSLICGTFLGALTALTRERNAGHVTTAGEIEMRTGLSVLTTVPFIQGSGASPQQVNFLTLANPDEPGLEGLRRLRTTLKFTMRTAADNRILVTSAGQNDGKTFVSLNLAFLLARSGKRVLLLDANSRPNKPGAHHSFPQPYGLNEVMKGTRSLEQAVWNIPDTDVDVLSWASGADQAAETLGSEAFGKKVESFSSRYDFVIVSVPPVLTSSAAAALASSVGTVLLVARTGQTSFRDLAECASRLSQVGRTFNGIILNGVGFYRPIKRRPRLETEPAAARQLPAATPTALASHG